MEAELQEKIEVTVRQILEESNMNETTEYKIRKMASEKLHLDLSQPNYKAFVRGVVQSFLEEQKAKEEQEQEEEVEEKEEKESTKGGGVKEFDDDGDLIVCRLSDKRKVTIQEFRGKALVSIREFYQKDGKELPSSKGISLTEDQWSTFKKNVPAIEKAIARMESRLR